MLCRQIGHAATDCPSRRQTHRHRHLASVHLARMLWVGLFSMRRTVVLSPRQRSWETRVFETHLTSTISSRSRSRVWQGTSCLKAEPRKLLLTSRVFNPVADRYEEATTETTDVVFTLADRCKHKGMDSAEIPQTMSVNLCVEGIDTCLIGLDVIREYGLVIDYHNNGVDSHILLRCLPLCKSFDKSSCSGDAATSNREITAPSILTCPLHKALGQATKGNR